MTKDAATFDSTTVPVTERPAATFEIGGVEYELRCPKLRVWMGVIERQEDYDAGQAIKPHIQEIYAKLAADPDEEERDKLIEQFKVLQPSFQQAPTALQLASLLVEFLCTCMVDKKDADKLRAAYHTDDGDVDIAHVRHALDEMDATFEPWLTAQADLVGVARPELPARLEPANRAERRDTTRRPAAGKKPVTVKRANARAR